MWKRKSKPMQIRQSWTNMNMTNMVFSSILSNTPILYSIEQLFNLQYTFLWCAGCKSQNKQQSSYTPLTRLWLYVTLAFYAEARYKGSVLSRTEKCDRSNNLQFWIGAVLLGSSNGPMLYFFWKEPMVWEEETYCQHSSGLMELIKQHKAFSASFGLTEKN